MNITYEINKDNIWCDEEFISIKINNSFGLITEQVRDMPLLSKPYNRIVGCLVEADEDYIYGIMYSASDLCNESFSMEICNTNL